MKKTLPIILLFAYCCANAQNKNAYRFIEPNISISFDSTRFKMGDTYSNHFYGTEAVDFKWTSDTMYRISTNVAAKNSEVTLSKSKIDSIVMETIGELKVDKTMPIIKIDDKPVDVHGFSFYGFVMREPKTNEYMTMLVGWHGFEGGYTEVKHVSFKRNDLSKEYEIVRELLADYKWYAPAQIEQEESLIKKLYSVKVDSAAVTADEKKYDRASYVAIVGVEQPAQHKLVCVELRDGAFRQIFDFKDGKTARVICSHREPGQVTRKADLVIANSFGKKVRIPFTVTYTQN